MRPKSLLSFDAFNKTDEEVRVRTSTGGFITVCCILTGILLLQKEWVSFYEITDKPKLVVDRDRHLKLELNLDVTFPSLSCDLVGLDLVDNSGETHLDVLEAGFLKIRLDKEGKELDSGSALDIGSRESLSSLDFDKAKYCGSCYGAIDQSKNDDVLIADDKICCQTCYDVRAAYLDAGWAFFDGEGIEQCEREGYVSKINDHINEGCRVVGSALLNRIQGNVHFAPGAAFDSSKGHFHDTSLYDKHEFLNFNHIINHLSFGKSGTDMIVPESFRKNKKGIRKQPLDGRIVIPDDRDTHYFQFAYYANIVPTRYESISGEVEETAQYSVTYHSKPLQGGRDSDHPNTIHGKSGIPGLFVHFQMEPLKVINVQTHAQTLSGFLLNVITTIGGVLAVGTVMDKLFYKAQRSIWGKKSQ